jgi:hypothetical protein
MKKMLLLVALVVALVPLVAVSAAAQGQAKPALSDAILVPGSSPIMAEPFKPNASKPPKYCSPCLFYTGDFNPSGSGADGVDNELGGSLGSGEYAEVYDGMTVPKGKIWTITKLFINTLATGSSSIDPTEPWDIRQGVTSGSGGTDVASGTGRDAFKGIGPPPGFGYEEYTNIVTLQKKAVLKAGTYFVDVLTSCQTSSCGGGEFFESDQESLPKNGKCTGTDCFGPPQPWDDSYFNSNYFGIAWELTTELCGTGYCDQFSFGAMGTSEISRTVEKVNGNH